MGFVLSEKGPLTEWVGRQLPEDGDDRAYALLLGCALSRLEALEPVDEHGRYAPADSLAVASDFVDMWWQNIVTGEEIDSELLPVFTQAMVPMLNGLNPAMVILNIGRNQIATVRPLRLAWEEATNYFDSLVGDKALRKWRATRFPPVWDLHDKERKRRRRTETRMMRSALPALVHLNVRLDAEAEIATGPVGDQNLTRLRSDAYHSAARLFEMGQQAAALQLPGPEAPFDDVLAAIATLDKGANQ